MIKFLVKLVKGIVKFVLRFTPLGCLLKLVFLVGIIYLLIRFAII